MKKLLIPTLVVTTALVAFSASKAYAQGFGKKLGMTEEQRAEMEVRMQEGEQELANFLGVSLETVQDAHENRTMLDLLNSLGVSQEDMDSFRDENRIEHMKANGLSDDEISERLERMEERGGRGFGPRNGDGQRGECINSQ